MLFPKVLNAKQGIACAIFQVCGMINSGYWTLICTRGKHSTTGPWTQFDTGLYFIYFFYNCIFINLVLLALSFDLAMVLFFYSRYLTFFPSEISTELLDGIPLNPYWFSILVTKLSHSVLLWPGSRPYWVVNSWGFVDASCWIRYYMLSFLISLLYFYLVGAWDKKVCQRLAIWHRTLSSWPAYW